jgi:hypothetical protein
MAHFAEIGLDNTVLRVIVVNNNELLDENEIEQEQLGKEFCRNLFGGTWVQTSYNGNFRKQFASIGYTYNSLEDVFVAPRPYASWSLDENHDWQPPVIYPDDGNLYEWSEDSLAWIRV